MSLGLEKCLEDLPASGGSRSSGESQACQLILQPGVVVFPSSTSNMRHFKGNTLWSLGYPFLDQLKDIEDNMEGNDAKYYQYPALPVEILNWTSLLIAVSPCDDSHVIIISNRGRTPWGAVPQFECGVPRALEIVLIFMPEGEDAVLSFSCLASPLGNVALFSAFTPATIRKQRFLFCSTPCP